MAPPSATRQRRQAAGTSSTADGKPRAGKRSRGKSQQQRWLSLLLSASAAVGVPVSLLAGVHWGWLSFDSGDFDDTPLDEETAGLMQDAELAIRQRFNYTLALDYLERAARHSPSSASVLQFHASVLLSLGQVERAWERYHKVFHSRSPVKRDQHFLQQYVLTLHRLHRDDELKTVWPRIVSTPSIKWRSPLQCPDFVDESLLESASPFPSMQDLRVPRLLQQHGEKILSEFELFRRRDDWDSANFFQPNQDNDLVLGNTPSSWTEMLFFDRGQWSPQHCSLLPTICKTLRGLLEIEGIAHNKRSGQVSLLKLEEGTSLVPHFGSVNWRYTAHLGLIVPEGVTMRGGSESRLFRRGEVLLLDDSFLHSVEHRGVGPRITLFANFFHPKVDVFTHEEWLDRRDRL